MKGTGMKVWTFRFSHAWAVVTAGLLLWLTPGISPAANTMYRTDGTSIPLRAIQWIEATKEYRVQPANATSVVITVALKDVDHLVIERPSDMAKAQQLISEGNLDQAIPLLEGIASKYKMLVWDDQSRALLAKIYLKKKDPKKAVAIFEELRAAAPRKSVPAELRRAYWDALLMTGQTAALKKDLDEAIATGPREGVAAAQVIRGNILRSEDLKEDALVDYLRTVLFFEDARDARPEALFKAAELCDELRDARGEELRKLLLQQYPDSELSKKTAGKM
jgi:tetratricopeptide (TPR) repeat protein